MNGVKFIVNPVAGRGRGRRVWQAVQEMLERDGYPYSVAFSSRPGEGPMLARQAAREGCRLVVALGGDGTVNEVANGIMGSGAALGIVPAGTGSDYIRSLPLPKDPLEAARTLYTGRRLTVDVGLVNNRYFLGVTGIGIDAEVCRRVNEDLTWLGGKKAYIAGLLATLVSYRPQPVKIVMDQLTLEEEVMFVAVANARFFGGGMEIAPQANLQDGLLDVCVIKALPKLELLRAFPGSLPAPTPTIRPSRPTGPAGWQLPDNTPSLSRLRESSSAGCPWKPGYCLEPCRLWLASPREKIRAEAERRETMLFADRYDAGRRLAEKLSHYQGKNPLILAVPRGAYP